MEGKIAISVSRPETIYLKHLFLLQQNMRIDKNGTAIMIGYRDFDARMVLMYRLVITPKLAWD